MGGKGTIYACKVCSATGADYYIDTPAVTLPSGVRQWARIGLCPQCRDTPEAKKLIGMELELSIKAHSPFSTSEHPQG